MEEIALQNSNLNEVFINCDILIGQGAEAVKN